MPPMQFRVEQILTKADGDRFREGVVNNEIIDTDLVRLGVPASQGKNRRKGMSEPDGGLPSCQATGLGTRRYIDHQY